jgi:hypothetical protein
MVNEEEQLKPSPSMSLPEIYPRAHFGKYHESQASQSLALRRDNRHRNTRLAQHNLRHQSSRPEFTIDSLYAESIGLLLWLRLWLWLLLTTNGTERQPAWLAPKVVTMPSGHDEHPMCQEAAMAWEKKTTTASWALPSL